MLLRGCGGCSSDFSWPGRSCVGGTGGKNIILNHRGCSHRGCWSPCRAVEVTAMELPVLQENQGFVQALGYGGNSQRKHIQSQAGMPSIPLLGDPKDLSARARGCVTPGHGLGGLTAAGALQDTLGTSQNTIPGLQPSPNGTDTSPSSRRIPKSQLRALQSGNKA